MALERVKGREMINKQTVIKVCNFSSLILEKITEIDYNNTSTVNLLSVVTKKRIKDFKSMEICIQDGVYVKYM